MSDDWQDELLEAADAEAVLQDAERETLDRLYGPDAWRDWTREELCVVLVFSYAEELAFELLAARAPSFLFGDEVRAILSGLKWGRP